MNKVYLEKSLLEPEPGDKRELKQRLREFALDWVAKRIMHGYSPIEGKCVNQSTLITCLEAWESAKGSQCE